MMQRFKDILIVVLFVALLWVWRANADDPPNPDAGPASTKSYTMNTIYERLDNGAEGAKSAFTEPSGAPATGTMHTLDDVMEKAPAADDSNGASKTDVLSDKTFWGLNVTSGEWGLQSGSMVNQGDKSYTPKVSEQTITAGYYDGTGKVEGDSDLIAGKIKKDVEIFGVTGSVIEATGDATAADVLSGKSFSNAGSASVSGSMDNQGDKSYTPNASEQTITAGYYDGTGKVEGDSDLIAGKIKKDVEIFGVTGSVIEATGDATAADVLSGKTFSNAGSASVSGSMVNQGAKTITPATSDQTIPEGYHNGSGIVSGDSDLVADNIKKDVEIFGVTGTFEMALVPKTGQTTCYDASYNEGDCSESGQDGEYKKGIASPNPRFTANGDNNGDGDCSDSGETCDGTVTDNLTGLIWLKNANCADGKRNWVTALSDVKQLNTDGKMNGNDCGDTSNSGSHQTDWRLPNIKELQSLIDYGQSNPALPSAHPFTDVQSNNYWSSTTQLGRTKRGWYAPLSDGDVRYGNKTSRYYVWAVRGGQ